MPFKRETDDMGWLPSLLGGLWHGLRGVARAALYGLTLLALLTLLLLWWTSRPVSLKERTVLVIAPQGALMEQVRSSPRERLIQQLQGRGGAEPSLPQWLRALDRAAEDPHIGSVLLRLDGLGAAGLAQQRELAAAVLRFRASGKKVVVWSTQYSQRAYYIAAHADEVYLHPMGAVQVAGYGRLRNYYRDALDRAGLQVQLVRAGEFKNAAEPFVANGPSQETQQSDAALQQALWGVYHEGVEKARRLPAGQLHKLIESLPDSLSAAGGDPARWALDNKLIDGLMTPDALRTLMLDRGTRDEANKSFRQISLAAYLERWPEATQGDGVALVVAEGEIADSPAAGVGPGVAELVRRAREDDRAKAVLLRVNSPGGSPLVSELIRRELQLTRAAGKPVVVSMGDVAASGGYWISMSADEIVADAGSITGSVGVFALLPSAAGLLDKLSVHTAGSGTHWLATAPDWRRPPDPRWQKMVQTQVDHLYADFQAKAAAARKLPRDKLEASAKGQVWTGAQAKERGLVDRIGSYADAMAIAKARAKLSADAPVFSVQPPSGRLQRLWQWLEARWIAAGPAWLGASAIDQALALTEAAEAAQASDAIWLLKKLSALAGEGQVGAPLAHCLCAAQP